MNNKRFFTVAVLASLAMLAQSANAAKGFSYSYGEFGYQNVEAVSGDGDGFKIGFSFGATDYINILGEYNRLFGIDDIEELGGIKNSTNADVDRDEFKIGLGGHYPLTDSLDLTLSAKYVDQEFSGKWTIPSVAPLKTNLTNSEEGYEVEFGARVQLFKKFEMTPHIIHRDVGADSNSGGGLGFVYNFHKDFSLRLQGTFFSDDSESNMFAGVRLDL
jgi:hypothetical protein